MSFISNKLLSLLLNWAKNFHPLMLNKVWESELIVKNIWFKCHFQLKLMQLSQWWLFKINLMLLTMILEDVKSNCKNSEKLFKCLCWLLKSSLILVLIHQKVSCFMVLLVQEKPWQQELLLTEQMLLSSESLDLNSFKSTLERVPEWSDKFSKWQEPKRPALFSLIKSTLLEEPDLMMDQEVIMRSKELCFKLSTKWMDLNQGVTLKF